MYHRLIVSLANTFLLWPWLPSCLSLLSGSSEHRMIEFFQYFRVDLKTTEGDPKQFHEKGQVERVNTDPNIPWYLGILLKRKS